MSEPLTLNPQIVGQAEKAHNAFLFRALDGSGVDEPQWITLVLALRSGGSLPHDEAVEAVTSGAFFSKQTVERAVHNLLDAGLLTRDGDVVTVTERGAAFVQRVRAETAQIVERAYADIPADDLATAARVLTTITERLARSYQ
jgi:DNA-binding MarR family transcriptional regulator